MNVLWIHAHPEPRSLGAALRDGGVAQLRELGHDVTQSDLYAMGWDPVVGAADFGHDPADRLVVGDAAQRAYAGGTLAPDIRVEIDKIRRADALVIGFPLWWYGMPAILKGWFDRVFVKGLAYGVRGADGRTRRYGDGPFTGKRALVVVTAGAPEPSIGPRGVNGEFEQLLFPLLHGTLFYTGMDVLSPLLVPGADRAAEADHAAVRTRLRGLATDAPIPYRPQNGGGYDDCLVLRPEHAPDRTGLDVHRADR